MSAPDASEVNWGVEVVLKPDADAPTVEYYSAASVLADGELVVINTSDGTEVYFRREDVIKLLVMRAVELPALPPVGYDNEDPVS